MFCILNDSKFFFFQWTRLRHVQQWPSLASLYQKTTVDLVVGLGDLAFRSKHSQCHPLSPKFLRARCLRQHRARCCKQ